MDRTASPCLDVLLGGNDIIDLVFEGANLNPARLDCPTREVLEQLAGRSLPIEHGGYRHLAQCSQCYREFRTRRTRESDERSAKQRAETSAPAGDGRPHLTSPVHERIPRIISP